jgi:hypothetical protein
MKVVSNVLGFMLILLGMGAFVYTLVLLVLAISSSGSAPNCYPLYAIAWLLVAFMLGKVGSRLFDKQ